MTQSYSFQQLFLNQLSFPSELLTSYKYLDLNEQDVVVILHIHHFLQKRIDFPTPTEISEHLSMSENDCINILRKLIQKGLLKIEESKNEANQLSEVYNLNPLWEKILINKNEREEETESSIFILFEQEFARPLSPFEIEMINSWLDEDKLKPSLIKAALREAVLMSALNFKYIDRILREWKRKDILSVEQARQEGMKVRKNQPIKQYESKKRDASVYFNWLEGGNS